MRARQLPDRTVLALWAGGLAAVLATALSFDPKLYINGDNVDYMFLARAARQGDLWASAKYPPLFPLLLVPVQWCFGLALIPQKLLVLAFYALGVAFLAPIVRRRVPGIPAAAVLFVAATLIPLLEYAHYVMSEVPFFTLLSAGLWMTDRELARADAPTGSAAASSTIVARLGISRELLGAAVALGMAFYVRTAGVAAWLGITAALALARPRVRAVGAAVLLAVCALPWAWHALTTPGGNPYVEQFLRVNPYYPEFGHLTPASLLDRLGENARVYFLEELPVTVFPLAYRSTYSPQGIRNFYYPVWLALLVLVPLGVGLVRALRRADPAAFVLATMLLLNLLWPPIWSATRFLVPLAPFAFLLFWMGVVWLLQRWRVVSAALLVILALVSVKNVFGYVDETRRYPPEWEHYFAALGWLKEHAPKDVRVIDRKPNFVEFVAERSASSFPRESDIDRMLDSFVERKGDYVVLPNLPYDDISRYLAPAVLARKPYFVLKFKSEDPEAYVLEFRSEAWQAHRDSLP